MFTFVIDSVLSGTDRAKLALIFLERHEQIANDIQTQLSRGVTVLFGRGWYTRSEKNILMCVVKKQELYKIKLLIHALDPNAFIIFTDASEVLGYGFKEPLI